MSHHDPTYGLSRYATRRRVVASSAKLAYAAPVVAATMAITSRGSVAAVSGGCLGPGQLCHVARAVEDHCRECCNNSRNVSDLDSNAYCTCLPRGKPCAQTVPEPLDYCAYCCAGSTDDVCN